jgi:uncharacterized protein (TIGR02118 family)
MIKGMALIVKKPGVSEEFFHRHWREIHGPLALRIKALRRYQQCHRIAPAIPGFETVPYDGVADIWFDSLKVIEDFPTNPDYVNGALADEPNFIDQLQLAFLATREHVIIEGPRIAKDTPLVKALFLLRRLKGMSVADFQAYWLHEHAPQIPRDAGVVRYVQCHQLPETYATSSPAYDGSAELYFENVAAFQAYWNSPRIQAIFAADAPRFLDGSSTAFLAEEYRVLWP